MSPRRVPALAVAAGLAVLAAGCDGSGDDGGDGAPTDRTAPFPMSFRLPALGGGEIALEDLRGKVVLVDLFGTWSEACRRSAPTLVSFHVRYRPRGFEIVGLAYERVPASDEARALVEAFAERYKVPYPLALGTEAVREQVPGGVPDFPTIVLVDRQGVGRARFVGFPPGQERLLAEEIEALLAEPGLGTP